MHLKSTHHRPDGQPPRHKCSSPPPIFSGTRRRRTDDSLIRPARLPRFLALAALALAGAVLGMLVSTVQAQERDEVLQSVSEGATDLPNDNTTPGRVAVGGSATGAIGIPKDQDRFAVDLEAGRTYRFDLTGRPGGGGTLPDTNFRAIYNSEGRYQSGSYNDDFDGGRDSRVTFTPTQSGTYYARVSGDRDETGTYTLSVTDITGPASKPAVADGPPGLAPNAPNPFNASTLIPYRLDAPGPVRLVIYNLLGQSIRTLVDEVQAAGPYRVHWDARDGRGAGVAAGVYLVRLRYPGGVQTRRMLYLE